MRGGRNGRESGSRREWRERREGPGRRPGRRRGPTQEERLNGAVADVAVFRAVSYRDLKEVRFDGHPYAARRGIERLQREGLVELVRAAGPRGRPFTVVVATAKGARRGERLLRAAGRPDRVWHGAVKRGEMGHDCAVYREVSKVAAEAEADGKSVCRVRTEAELKSELARRSEAARRKGGRKAADRARLEAAREMGLPVSGGRVSLPDARVELAEDGGLAVSRVDIEVVSGSYKASQIAAKAAAGFRMAAAGEAAERRLSAVVGGGRRGGGGRRHKDPGVVEL